MVTIFLGVAWAVALLLTLPALSDVVSLIRIALRRQSPPAPASTHPPRLLFLVPAHDEEVLIEACIRSLRALRYPATGRAIVVLADNCTDRTVEIARAAGAQILERHDRDRPGKPEALAWAFPRLALDRYDAVVIVDADAVVNTEFAIALAERGPLRGKIVQPYNDVRNPEDNALTRLAALFAAARFRFSYRLKDSVGLSIPLGAGMCIGTDILARYGWDAFSISEDWEFYASSTARGIPMALAPAARLAAQEERYLGDSLTQRQRWLAGKIAMARQWLPALAMNPTIGVHQAIDAIGEILAPGPVIHLALVVALALPLLALRCAGCWAASAALFASLVRPMLYTGLALFTDPRPLRAIWSFTFLPFYAVWRVHALVGTLKLLRGGAWIRTQRQD